MCGGAVLCAVDEVDVGSIIEGLAGVEFNCFGRKRDRPCSRRFNGRETRVESKDTV